MREVLMAIASLSCCFRSAREPGFRGGRNPGLAAASRLPSSDSELLATMRLRRAATPLSP
ncbi:MAG: hypothetical protein VKO44_11200 [Cyanobacteriota bacterium]|jgi:hypothetical protein|nr:hypothetical protein [Cyanobacteriota bacterium]